MNFKIHIIAACILALTTLSCSYTKSVNSGEDALALRQYNTAIPSLSRSHENASSAQDKAQYANLLGQCYQKMNNIEKSAEWFAASVRAQSNAQSLEKLGDMLKQLERYDDAIAAYNQAMANNTNKGDIQRKLATCKQARDWFIEMNKMDFIIQPVAFNSPYGDYSPVFFMGDQIVFSSDRRSSTGENIYNWTGNKFSDIFVVSKNANSPEPFDDAINTEHNEGSACFSKDKNQIFFTRCYQELGDDHCKILWSRYEFGQWSEPIEAFEMLDNTNYGQPALIENDSVLIFSSDLRIGEGGKDLFYSILDENGWGEPIPMPDQINTMGNEMFPTTYNDTLYYSSDFLPGMGGLDLFKTYLDENYKWVSPQNMKPPINSGADDFAFIMDESYSTAGDIEYKAYFTSTRDGNGDDNIFSVVKKVSEVKEPEVVADLPKPRKDYKTYLAIRVVENQFSQEGNPNSPIIGKIPMARMNLQMIDKSTLKTQRKRTNDEGRYITEVDSTGLDIIIKIGKEGYFNQQKSFSIIPFLMDTLTEDRTFNVELVLDKIYENQEIVLSSIYYDYNQYVIREDAKPALDSLSKILIQNPKIKIQLSSHTDCRGDVDFNQNLSQKRAEAAVQYMISRGVDRSRIIPQGYGESVLANNCQCELCTEEEHQTNRRTTFKVLSIN